MLAAAVARWAPPVLVLIGDGWCWSFRASLPGILWEFPSRTKSKGFNASQECLRKHPTALLVAFNLTPKLQPCGKSHLVNVQKPFVYHHYYYSFHRENLCCSSSCQEQVFTRQPVTRVAPGGKRRSGQAFCVELRFSLRVRLKWRERHQLLTLLLPPFCLTFLFFWHWFERKNINKTN